MFPTNHFATPLDTYNKLTDEGREIVDSIKYFANNFPTSFIWHDGVADDECQFHGLHVHMICASDKKLSQITMVKTTKQRLSRHRVDIKCQKVRYINNLARHLQTAPRQLLGCNNLNLCPILHANKPEPDEAEEAYCDVNFQQDDSQDKTDKPENDGISWIKQRIDSHQRRQQQPTYLMNQIETYARI